MNIIDDQLVVLGMGSFDDCWFLRVAVIALRSCGFFYMDSLPNVAMLCNRMVLHVLCRANAGPTNRLLPGPIMFVFCLILPCLYMLIKKFVRLHFLVSHSFCIMFIHMMGLFVNAIHTLLG